MKAVYGLYPDPDLAQLAVNKLRAAGVADTDIVVISSEPFEHYDFAHRDAKTSMPWIAVCGGLLGMVSGVLLTRTTQLLWPLKTGGMPIVAMWPNLVVIFELTMLGAIVASVITLLVSAGLPSRRTGKLYDPEVSDGYILVGVENPSDAARLEPALAIKGSRVKTTS